MPDYQRLGLIPPEVDEEDLDERVRRLEQQLDELHAFLVGAQSDLAESPDGGSEHTDDLDVTDLDEWVRTVLLPAYCRFVPQTGGAQRWCPTWWRHAEAILRLDALRRAGRALVPQGGVGPSVWWREHVDHHLTLLLSPDGPFAGCSPTKHTPSEPLPATPLPPAAQEVAL